MKILPVILCALLLVSSGISEETASELNFKTNGFSIDALEGQADVQNYQAIMMFLPPADGFSPNVNVQIQKYDGSLKSYMELSRGQLKSMGLVLKNEKTINDRSVRFEYSGIMNGVALRWYARAIKTDDKVYLVTATARASHWDKVASKLIKCVDSFKTTH